MSKLLAVENLGLCYPGADEPIFSELNLTLNEGDMIGIAGLSGCGKSSLALALTGIIPLRLSAALSGRIAIAGKDAAEMTLQERGLLVGLVMQDADDQLFTMCLEDDIAFGPENLNLTREQIKGRISSALDKTGIAHLRKREPTKLSGGEKHLACLACVLAMHPSLLILDETLSDLDMMAAKSVLDVARRFCEDGGACVMIEHNLEMLAQCQVTYLMAQGSLTNLEVAGIDAYYQRMIQAQGLEMV